MNNNNNMQRGIRRWVVDLDLKPEERWLEIVDFYKDAIWKAKASVEEMLKQEIGKIMSPIITHSFGTIVAAVTKTGKRSTKHINVCCIVILTYFHFKVPFTILPSWKQLRKGLEFLSDFWFACS